MSDITQQADYLLKEFLADFLINGQPPHLPPAALGSGIDQREVDRVTTTLTTKLIARPGFLAGILMEKKEVIYLHGWLCDRWCAIYLFLKSRLETPVPETPLITALEPHSEFRWPAHIPPPWAKTDVFAVQANKILPWAVLPTILHEVAHAVIDIEGKTVHEIEFACDEFAARYFIGKRQDEFTDIIMLGLGAWQCSICSHSLANQQWTSEKHPNPVARLQRILRAFVPQNTGHGQNVWLLATAHIIMLARFYSMSDLDGVILKQEHASVDELLDQLRECWEPAR